MGSGLADCPARPRSLARRVTYPMAAAVLALTGCHHAKTNDVYPNTPGGYPEPWVAPSPSAPPTPGVAPTATQPYHPPPVPTDDGPPTGTAPEPIQAGEIELPAG